MPLSRRLSILLVFTLHGLSVGGLFARIADIRLALGLNEAQLGTALIGIPAGVLFGAQIAAPLISRFGTRPVMMGFFPVFAAAPLIASLAPDLPLLFAALMVFGFNLTLCNIAMNLEADRVEAATAARILNRCHAMWGVGFLVASLAGAGAIAAGLTPQTQFALHFLIKSTLALILLGGLRPSPERGRRKSSRRFALPGPAVLPILGFVTAGVVIEGTARNWSVIFLRDVSGAADTVASFALTAFITAQTAVRFLADFWIDRFGPVAVARALAVVGFAGLCLVVAGPGVLSAMAGFGLLGLGAATSHPQAISAAARLGGGEDASHNVAALTTAITVITFLSPPLIGYSATEFGLRTALALILPLPVLAWIMARSLASSQTIAKPGE